MIRHVTRSVNKSSWMGTCRAIGSPSVMRVVQSQYFTSGSCHLGYVGQYYKEAFRRPLTLSGCERLQHIPLRCFSAFQGQYRLLTEEESALLAEQRALTEKARALASQVATVQVRAFTDNFLGHILPDDQSTFSIVIAGEFNSGKSTLINALLGTKLLETGALPTTDSITILTHGPSDTTQTSVEGHVGVILHRVSGVSLLQDLTLIDTPGTNAVVLNHTARTMKLLPAADLILFVTSADRPFPESERTLLKSIQVYRKNIVVVVNKMDVLETSGGNYGEEEKQRVVDFVADHASDLLGARPIVIPISARDAISAKLTVKDQESGVWKRSNFAALESFLKETLTTETKIKSKLINPVGVAEGMMAECLKVLANEKRELEIDIATLNLLKSQFGGWEKEMNADIESFCREVGSILSHEGERCQRLVNRMSLSDRYLFAFDEDRLKLEWQRTKRTGANAVQGIEEELLSIIRETADSVATHARAQGQAVIEYLGKRPAVKSQSLVGNVTAASRFEETRKSLLEKMSSSVRSVLNDYNATMEEDNIIQAFRRTAALSGAIQLGTIGMIIAVATGAIDVVLGMAGTAAFAASGFLVMSHGSKRVSTQYREMWKDRQRRLNELLHSVCSKELERGVRQKILAGVVPYTRYVEAEEERIYKMTEECEAVQAAAQALRNRIEKLRR